MIKDITGLIFGKLRVISFANKIDDHYRWNCLCGCGNTVIVESYALKSGKTKSCGCIRNVVHGLSFSKEYRIWIGIRRRCYDKRLKHYPNYGGKGIKVCDDWQNSFLNFYEDMGKCPQEMTLDRIDSNGNYCKDNCRWATMKEQARNRSTNHYLEAFGKKQTIVAWSEETGIPWETIYGRLRRKLSVEDALTIKHKKSSK